MGTRASLVSQTVERPEIKDFPGVSDSKGDLGSAPGLGRSPGEGNGNLLQYTCLENPMDKGVWQATVRDVTKSQI